MLFGLRRVIICPRSFSEELCPLFDWGNGVVSRMNALSPHGAWCHRCFLGTVSIHTDANSARTRISLYLHQRSVSSTVGFLKNLIGMKWCFIVFYVGGP